MFDACFEQVIMSLGYFKRDSIQGNRRVGLLRVSWWVMNVPGDRAACPGCMSYCDYFAI